MYTFQLFWSYAFIEQIFKNQFRTLSAGRYNLVTEEEMLGMKWLDLKNDEQRTMDTYMDTKQLL